MSLSSVSTYNNSIISSSSSSMTSSSIGDVSSQSTSSRSRLLEGAPTVIYQGAHKMLSNAFLP